jgi:hypothetical protein
MPESLRMYEQFHATMLERAQKNGMTDEAKQKITADQMAAIFNATSEQEVWQADMGGTIQLRDAHGLKVQILDFRPDVSNKEFANSHGWYGTMNAVCLGGPMHVLRQHGLSVGDHCVLQTGADLFLAKVAKFDAEGALPKAGYVEAIETAAGNHVIKFWPDQEALTGNTQS